MNQNLVRSIMASARTRRCNHGNARATLAIASLVAFLPQCAAAVAKASIESDADGNVVVNVPVGRGVSVRVGEDAERVPLVMESELNTLKETVTVLQAAPPATPCPHRLRAPVCWSRLCDSCGWLVTRRHVAPLLVWAVPSLCVCLSSVVFVCAVVCCCPP